MSRTPRIVAAVVAGLLVLAAVALAAATDGPSTRVAASAGGGDDVATSSTVDPSTPFWYPTTTTKPDAATAPATRPRPVTSAVNTTPRPPTPPARPPAPGATTTPPAVPVGPPMTSRPGTDADYTWIEGTDCRGGNHAVRLEVFDQQGRPIGGDTATPRADGSWSAPMAPPAGKATVRGDCFDVTTQAVSLTYPPLTVTFS